MLRTRCCAMCGKLIREDDDFCSDLCDEAYSAEQEEKDSEGLQPDGGELMAAAITHALSSQKRWGGQVEDYTAIHNWFDETKAHVGDFRHRALRHHGLGVDQCIARFGELLSLTDECGNLIKNIPTRWVCEQHLIEDFGRIPNVADWLRCISAEPWMTRSQKLSAVV